MQVCWQQILLVFLHLMVSYLHSWMILSLDIELWVDNCFSFILERFCPILLNTPQFLIRSNLLIDCCPSLCTMLFSSWSLSLLSVLLMMVRVDVGFSVFILLCVSILYLQICLFSTWFFFIVSISRLRLLISLLRLSCIENTFYAMKTLRRVLVAALKSLSVSSNIWFILGLNSIDFLLCRERVPFSWFLGCREILDCILNNIKLWRFLSGFELQTLYFT